MGGYTLLCSLVHPHVSRSRLVMTMLPYDLLQRFWSHQDSSTSIAIVACLLFNPLILNHTRQHNRLTSKQHIPTNLSRAKIVGMPIVAERPHNKYGSAILIREDLKVENVYEIVQGTVELITIVMSGVVVHYVYKPPNNQFVLPALGHRDLPHLTIGDFKVVHQVLVNGRGTMSSKPKSSITPSLRRRLLNGIPSISAKNITGKGLKH